jgi:riboflavin biosynthesis pyrimidine reductase
VVAGADGADVLTRFAARKTRAAREAVLEPFLTKVESPPSGLEAIGDAWTCRIFDGPFYQSPAPADLPACNLVIVQSRDGNTGAEDPSVLGGGATDKHLIYEGLSRAAADAVVAGSTTVGGGDLMFSVWREEFVAMRRALGLPRHPAQVVFTSRGVDLDSGLLYNSPELRVVVVTTDRGVEQMRRQLAARPWIDVVSMAEREDIAPAFAELRQRGLSRLSAVGGRHLARSLVQAGLVQDLYLTTGATDGGEPGTPLFEQTPRSTLVLRKRGTGRDTGVRFEHWMPVR